MKRATLILLLALAACDESVAFHEADPSWNRMMEQPRVDAYEGMREPPRGTVARDDSSSAPSARSARETSGEEAPPVTRALLERGRGRFETFCATCHGILGDGRTVVATKMELRKPPSLVEGKYLDYDTRRLEDVIERGFGLMPSYADALVSRDRWAVANYVKALQTARASRVTDLPPSLRDEIGRAEVRAAGAADAAKRREEAP